jgi:RNase P subunit RPR2
MRSVLYRPSVSELMKPQFEGEHGRAICEHCQQIVTATYVRRNMPFSDGRGEAKDVLARVCDVCDTIVVFPAQSTPALKEAREQNLTLGNGAGKVGKGERLDDLDLAELVRARRHETPVPVELDDL